MEGLISVIVPVYNCEKYIEKCIDSILKQTYSNFEILVVDDGSSDSSLKICKELEKKDSRITVFHQKNNGVSSARNYGVSKANGDFISFIDSDDWVNERFFEILIKGYKYEKIDLSVTGIIAVEDSKRYLNTIIEKEELISKEEAYKKMMTDTSFFGFPVNKLYRKKIIKELGEKPFNEEIHACEDTLFNTNYLKRCRNILYNRSKVYYYYQRPDSATQTKNLSQRKMTVFKALKQIEEIYMKESPNNLEFFYEFFLNNYFIVRSLFKEEKFEGMPEESDVERAYKYLKNSSKIPLTKKIKIHIKYRHPLVFDAVRKIKRK